MIDRHSWPIVRLMSQPTDLPTLEGALSPNDRLFATERLHEGVLIAPEAFAEGVCRGYLLPLPSYIHTQ